MTEIKSHATSDVRMHGFARRHTVAASLAWLDAQLRPLDSEDVLLRAAAGRVLAASITSDIDIPGFDRATMDGYAVVADSTEGATPYNRVPLTVIGDALPGSPFARGVARGEAVRIMTGAPMPAGSDAVLPAESAERDTDAPARVLAVAEVSPLKNVGRRGEDIVAGTTVLEPGRVLRPQDVGVISSIGVDRVTVVRQPRVRLVITGNELLPAGSSPRGYQITDANGPMLAALAERDGAIVDFPGLIRDEAEAILYALKGPPAASAHGTPAATQGGPHDGIDIVIVSGGSSVGIEDLAPMLVATHGELAVHGIAMRPSSPTGLGRIGDRVIFLLPGNPVSALCAYDFFAGRAIRALGGRSKEWPYRKMRGTLTRKISSPIGRLDYARVRVDGSRVEPLAVAGASVLSSTTRADGFVIVGDDSEGFAAGCEVDAWLYA
jgi:molybdopterin molybdotransferase